METSSKILVKDLSIGYNKANNTNCVFKDLNFELCTGQLIGLVGANGVGKSTLLKTISGLQNPIDGDIKIDAVDVCNYSKQKLSKKISVVLTEKVEGFNLKVFDLVSMGRVPYTNAYHTLQKLDFEIIENSLVHVGISEYRNTFLAELSDGLYQKAMIAKGLAQQTNYFLLDEPTAFLDFNSKHQLFELLRHLAKENQKGIIVSTHDIDLLLKYSTHLLILDENNSYQYIKTSECHKSNLFNKLTSNYFLK